MAGPGLLSRCISGIENRGAYSNVMLVLRDGIVDYAKNRVSLIDGIQEVVSRCFLEFWGGTTSGGQLLVTRVVATQRFLYFSPPNPGEMIPI